MFHATMIMVMVWVGFFLLFFCNLSVKGHYPSPFPFPCKWHIRENTSDSHRAKFLPFRGQRAPSRCQPGDDAQRALSGRLFLFHPQNPSSSQFTVFKRQQTVSIFPPLDRVRSTLLWKYLLYFGQRARCALQLPCASHTRCFPGTPHGSSRISVTHPHTRHLPTLLILPYFAYSGHSYGISTLLCASDLSPPRATARFPQHPPAIPNQDALNPLFPSLFSFPLNIFWFTEPFTMTTALSHHFLKSTP